MIKCSIDARLLLKMGLATRCWESARGFKQAGMKDFDLFIDSRMDQAQKSVLFQVSHVNSVPELYNYCSGFGAVMKMFFVQSQKDAVLVEFATRRSVKSLIDSVQHFGNIDRHPVVSRNLHYLAKTRTADQNVSNLPETLCTYVRPRKSAEAIFDEQTQQLTVSEQIRKFFLALKQQEIDIRLKFFVATTIQDSFSGLFPDCLCLPFGSSVSSLGKYNCDLDSVFCFEDYRRAKERLSDSGIRFLTKRSFLGDRQQAQIYLKIFSAIIKHFTPECTDVQIILPAKVPILRFQQRLANVSCDMSMSDFSGSYYMSKLLWTLTSLDKRIAPLFFAIRQWAQMAEVTLPYPGPWLSNFQLTLLFLYFAQCTTPAIIPKLHVTASPHTEHKVSIGRKSDMRNQSSLETLLREFFLFYSSCESTTFSLHDENTFLAGNGNNDVFLQNPLYPTVCASKNLSVQEFTRFRLCCTEALKLVPNVVPSSGEWFSRLMLNPPKPENEDVEARKSKAYPAPVHVLKDFDTEIQSYGEIE